MPGIGAPANERTSALAQLDDAPLGAMQIRTFVLCALVALLDGIDNQSIGVVAPLMAKDLGLTKTSLGLIFSIAQIGATLGALGFGPFADRFGRKTATLVALSGITIFTYLTALTPTFAGLLLVRFAAGIALAGAIPCVLALGSEYAPLRLRGTVASAIFAGYPLGASIGGVVSAYLLASYDWRWIFYIGALMPFLTLIVLCFYLPESLRFLLSKGGREDSIKRIAASLGITIEASEQTATPIAARKTKVPISRLFTNGLLASTMLLWVLYFFCYAMTKIMVVWLPSLLTDIGFGVSDAALAQASFNLGCALGMAVAGHLVDRFGAARALAPALMLGAGSVALLGIAGHSFTLVLGAAAGVGLLIGIGGSGAHSIAATLYPTEIRTTGLGWGMASSRLGQVMSPMLVASLLSVGVAGSDVYFVLAVFPVIAAFAAIGLGASINRRTRAAERHTATEQTMQVTAAG